MKVERKKNLSQKKRPRAKSVVFSKLPLTLKKQFLHLLTQNEVDFVRDGKFMEAVVQLKEDNLKKGITPGKNPTEIKPRYMDCLNKKGKKCFHKGCKLQDWERNNLKKRRARMRRKSLFKQERSKSQCDLGIRVKRQKSFNFDKENLDSKLRKTGEELRAQMRSIPYNRVDLDNFTNERIDPRDLKVSKKNFAEKVGQLIRENEVYDPKYYINNMANRIRYTKCDKRSLLNSISESKFIEYKYEGDKENMISPNTRNKRRQWEMKKSKSRKSDLPFSSVLNTPKSMKSRRKPSYTPSIRITDWNFEPLDKRLRERDTVGGEQELRVLRQLNDVNLHRRRRGEDSSSEFVETGREFEALDQFESSLSDFTPDQSPLNSKRQGDIRYQRARRRISDASNASYYNDTVDARKKSRSKKSKEFSFNFYQRSRSRAKRGSSKRSILIQNSRDRMYKTDNGGTIKKKNSEIFLSKNTPNRAMETDYNIEESREGTGYEGGDHFFNTKQTRENNNSHIKENCGLDTDTVDHRKGRMRSCNNLSLDYSQETDEQMKTSGTYKNSFINISKHSEMHKQNSESKPSGLMNASSYYNLRKNSQSGVGENMVTSRSQSPKDFAKRSKGSRLRSKKSKLESSLEKEMTRLYSKRIDFDSEEQRPIRRRGKSRSKSSSKKRRQLDKSRKRRKRRFKIPNNMEKRIQRRRSRSRGSLITEGKKDKGTPRKLFKFKNKIEEQERVDFKVDLDMLHTKELLSYYKEVLNKGKKDFVAHHREQNLGKYDYY